MALLPMPLLMIVWDAEAQSRNTPAQLLPTRSISLKTCGWEPTRHDPLGMNPTGYVPLIIAFDHQGNLWTGYTTKSSKLVPRTTPESGAQYNIVELSGSPVKCSAQLNRPTTESSPAAIMFSNKGSMLVVANDQLHLIDQTGFKDQVSFDLLRPSDHEYYRLRQSPGRKSLVVVIDGHIQAESSYTWLDPDTLKIIHRCTYPPAPDYQHYTWMRSFADDGRYVELDYAPNSVGSTFWIAGGQYCSEKTKIPPERMQPVDALMFDRETAYFSSRIDNGSIVVYHQNGSLIYLVPAQDREVKERSEIAVSEDGGRVALIIDTMAGGHPALDINEHVSSRRVDIFETATWTRTAQIELPITGRTEFTGDITLAFTPDGKTLALRMADLVQVYDGIP
jgi:hypothetical protein